MKICQGNSESNLSKILENEEHPDTPENIPEDSLVDILAAIHSRTSSTETVIVLNTQQTNEPFYCKPRLSRDRLEERKF